MPTSWRVWGGWIRSRCTRMHAKAVVRTANSGSPASRRVYEYAIDQFIAWYCSEPRLAFNRIVVVR
jgi:hypothetical protein